jgi:hypothetical protein
MRIAFLWMAFAFIQVHMSESLRFLTYERREILDNLSHPGMRPDLNRVQYGICSFRKRRYLRATL